jgi:hypothetical protein
MRTTRREEGERREEQKSEGKYDFSFIVQRMCTLTTKRELR